MKKIAFSLICALAIVGESLATNNTINVSELTERDGKYYEIGRDIPYTGRVIGNYYDGQLRSETHYKDGLKDGKEVSWYTNGNVRRELQYKNGERDGEWISWDENQRITFRHSYH